MYSRPLRQLLQAQRASLAARPLRSTAERAQGLSPLGGIAQHRLLSLRPSSSSSAPAASSADAAAAASSDATSVSIPDHDDEHASHPHGSSHVSSSSHSSLDSTPAASSSSSLPPPLPSTLPPTPSPNTTITALATKQDQSHGIYPGSPNNVLPFTSLLQVVTPDQHPLWPVYRVLEPDGRVRAGALEPQLDEATTKRMYKTMVRLQAMDTIFYNAQRQGRISFYMTSTGEEATHVGSAAALLPTDPVLAQYREGGVLMWRGFTLDQFADQCFSNKDDLGKGRQMPVHYGTAALHFQTISSPLATQIPQAVGAAYGVKLDDALKPTKEKRCVICYFGEGAASEGDFHAALNFASTLEAPVIFFCRNNGYAISTPVKDQFRGDGIVSRAAGYGMHAVRVDGNDLLAVFNACQAAREVCVKEGKPVLIEAMTYRVGHHSTSDDSTRYRSLAEIKKWHEHDCPLKRFRGWMEGRGWWSQQEEQQLRDEERMAVLRALERAEVKQKPGREDLFTDVYKEKPRHLKEQEEELEEHVRKYPEVYGGGGREEGH